MTLKFPQSNIPFEPNPRYFIGGFDVYDREESLGAQLNGFDPNDAAQAQYLLDKYIFPRFTSVRGYTAEHRKALADALLSVLSDRDYCFDALLEDNHNECFYLPSDWKIRDPREFFLQVYQAVVRHWHIELESVGVELPKADDLTANKSFKRTR
jgi:hypothetical protein